MKKRSVAGTVLFFFLVFSGCASLRESEARNKIDLMVAAGFVPKYADTPEKKAKLHSLDPLKAHTYVRDGETYYVFPDPEGCNCAYVGNQTQYAEYRRLAQEQQIAQEHIQAEVWSYSNPPYWGWDDHTPSGFYH